MQHRTPFVRRMWGCQCQQCKRDNRKLVRTYALFIVGAGSLLTLMRYLLIPDALNSDAHAHFIAPSIQTLITAEMLLSLFVLMLVHVL